MLVYILPESNGHLNVLRMSHRSFDDFLEKTAALLGIPREVSALPKRAPSDVAWWTVVCYKHCDFTLPHTVHRNTYIGPYAISLPYSLLRVHLLLETISYLWTPKKHHQRLGSDIGTAGGSIVIPFRTTRTGGGVGSVGALPRLSSKVILLPQLARGRCCGCSAHRQRHWPCWST